MCVSIHVSITKQLWQCYNSTSSPTETTVPEGSIMTVFCMTFEQLHVQAASKDKLVPVNMDCDMDSVQLPMFYHY